MHAASGSDASSGGAGNTLSDDGFSKRYYSGRGVSAMFKVNWEVNSLSAPFLFQVRAIPLGDNWPRLTSILSTSSRTECSGRSSRSASFRIEVDCSPRSNSSTIRRPSRRHAASSKSGAH